MKSMNNSWKRRGHICGRVLSIIIVMAMLVTLFPVCTAKASIIISGFGPFVWDAPKSGYSYRSGGVTYVLHVYDYNPAGSIRQTGYDYTKFDTSLSQFMYELVDYDGPYAGNTIADATFTPTEVNRGYVELDVTQDAINNYGYAATKLRINIGPDTRTDISALPGRDTSWSISGDKKYYTYGTYKLGLIDGSGSPVSLPCVKSTDLGKMVNLVLYDSPSVEVASSSAIMLNMYNGPHVLNTAGASGSHRGSFTFEFEMTDDTTPTPTPRPPRRNTDPDPVTPTPTPTPSPTPTPEPTKEPVAQSDDVVQTKGAEVKDDILIVKESELPKSVPQSEGSKIVFDASERRGIQLSKEMAGDLLSTMQSSDNSKETVAIELKQFSLELDVKAVKAIATGQGEESAGDGTDTDDPNDQSGAEDNTTGQPGDDGGSYGTGDGTKEDDSIIILANTKETSRLTKSQQETISKLKPLLVFEVSVLKNGRYIHSLEGGYADLTFNFDFPVGTSAGSEPETDAMCEANDELSLCVSLPKKSASKGKYVVLCVNKKGSIETISTTKTQNKVKAKLPHFSDYVLIYDEEGKYEFPTTITLNKTLKKGSSFRFLASGTESENIEYTSSNEKVASAAGGTITANKAGKAIITAKSGDYTFAINVTVKKSKGKVAQTWLSEACEDAEAEAVFTIYKAIGKKGIEPLIDGAYAEEIEFLPGPGLKVTKNNVIKATKKGRSYVDIRFVRDGRSYVLRVVTRRK